MKKMGSILHSISECLNLGLHPLTLLVAKVNLSFSETIHAEEAEGNDYIGESDYNQSFATLIFFSTFSLIAV